MITLETVINYKGKTMTVEALGTKFGAKTEEGMIKAVNILIAKKYAFVVEDKTDEESLLDDLINEDEILRRASEIEDEEEQSIQASRREELDEVDSLKIKLTFSTTLEAQAFEDKIVTMGIEEVSVVSKKGQISLLIEDITPEEYTKISRLYSMEKGVKSAVNAVSKGANSLSNAVNYGATNLIAPTAKIAGEVAMNLGKGLFQTITRAGAGFINAGGKAIRDTKVELSTDSELIKARAELRAGANGIKNTVREKKNKRRRSSGIEIL